MTNDSDKIREFMAINQKRWDELVDVHKASRYYNMPEFLNGKSSLMPFEEKELPDLNGKTVLHLMCHFGLDSLSMARKGAIVTGVDFSQKAVDVGNDMAKQLGLNATFIQANVYDLMEILNEKYDILYTSYGILAWLPDLSKWAEIISHFLNPGGEFYFFEIHPFTTLLEVNDSNELYIAYPYQCTPDKPEIIDEPGTYTDGAVRSTEITHTKRYEWFHSFQTIISSIAASGLKIEYVHEFPEAIFQMLPNLEPIGNGLYRFSDAKYDVPLTFSLKATKL